MALVWLVPPDIAFEAAAKANVEALESKAFMLLRDWAPVVEAWMKETRPWTDRTGMARATLRATAQREYGQLTLTVSHGMYYGWYLEGINPATMSIMLNAGQWDILNPALDFFAPQIWRSMRKLSDWANSRR